MKNICLICQETCKFPAILMLNCDCKYSVHYKCYKRWWQMNSNCIICLKKCEEPYSIKHFDNKSLYYEFLNAANNNQINEIENIKLIKNKKLHISVLFISYILIYTLNIPLIMLPIISFLYYIFIIP